MLGRALYSRGHPAPGCKQLPLAQRQLHRRGVVEVSKPMGPSVVPARYAASPLFPVEELEEEGERKLFLPDRHLPAAVMGMPGTETEQEDEDGKGDRKGETLPCMRATWGLGYAGGVRVAPGSPQLS